MRRLGAALAAVIMSLGLSVPAYGVTYGTIRNPISKNADFLTRMAIHAAGTCYPDARIRGNGWEERDANGHWIKVDDSRLYYYYALMDRNVKAKGGNNAYASCTQAVCAILGEIDPNVYQGSLGPQSFIDYCMSNPQVYEYVGHVPFSELRAGDIMCHSAHTAVYVGTKAAGDVFGDTLGNVWEAGWTTYQLPGIDCWFTLGRHTLGELDDWSEYVVFRVR